MFCREETGAGRKGGFADDRIKDRRFENIYRAAFYGGDLDHWLVREVNIVTFNSFTIDGRIRQGYYSDEELEANRIEGAFLLEIPEALLLFPDQGKEAAGKLPDYDAALAGGE